MTKMFKPKIPDQKIAAAPATPASASEVPVQELGGSPEKSQEQRRKRGRNALRIDPQLGGMGLRGGSSGINIPMK